MQVVLRYLYGYNGDMAAEVDTDDLNISFILHIDRAINKLEVPALQPWAPMVAGWLLALSRISRPVLLNSSSMRSSTFQRP